MLEQINTLLIHSLHLYHLSHYSPVHKASICEKAWKDSHAYLLLLLKKVPLINFFPSLSSQFVPFRDYIDRTGNHILSMARLAKDVLAEIPDQFLSYMRTRGIKPSPAPPPYTPPGQPIQTQIWGARRRKVSESGVSWTSRAKYFHFPKAALHALFLCSGSCMSDQESVTFADRKSQWESVYFHCQAFLLLSGTWTGFRENLESLNSSWEIKKKGKKEEMKDTSLEIL